MDVVANLFALVSEDLVFTALDVALDQIAEEAMQLDAGMVRACQATGSQTTRRHIEVAAILLNHNVRRQFRRSEQRVFTLIDGEIFGDSVLISRISVFPTRLQFPQSDCV